MNINPEFNQEERPNAEEAMSQAMSFLYENFILPKTADLNKDDLDTLTIIGAIFKDMAKKPKPTINYKKMVTKKMIFLAIKY